MPCTHSSYYLDIFRYLCKTSIISLFFSSCITTTRWAQAWKAVCNLAQSSDLIYLSQVEEPTRKLGGTLFIGKLSCPSCLAVQMSIIIWFNLLCIALKFWELGTACSIALLCYFASYVYLWLWLECKILTASIGKCKVSGRDSEKKSIRLNLSSLLTHGEGKQLHDDICRCLVVKVEHINRTCGKSTKSVNSAWNPVRVT